MKGNLRVNGARLWDSLMAMAQIGPGEKGGNCRLALSDEDKLGRDLFVKWCRDAGCDIVIDQMGNVFARRQGEQPELPPIVTGSHLDTQPHGGRFDGVYGVLAGLEVIRTLNDSQIKTQRPIEVAVWTNEEGARFAPSMIASGVFSGAYSVEDALAITDGDGRSIGEELERIGYAGEQLCGDHPVGAFFEAHIEQGPLLERESKTIGVVTTVQGLRWYDAHVAGQDAHAGSTPMPGRRNALVGAASMVSAIDALALDNAPAAVATVGQLDVSPNSRNTIPGQVDFTVDLRHPDAYVLASMDERLRSECDAIASALKLEFSLEQVSYTAPITFDSECVEAVREASAALGYAHREMASGAGHDACYVSKVAPTGMIFVPCRDGLSHNEEESAEPDDLEAGCNVLLHAMLSRAETRD